MQELKPSHFLIISNEDKEGKWSQGTCQGFPAPPGEGSYPTFQSSFSSDSSLSANRWEAEDRKRHSLCLAPRGGEKKLSQQEILLKKLNKKKNQQLSFSSETREGGSVEDKGSQTFPGAAHALKAKLSSSSLFCSPCSFS